jgi:hypothetical protein
VTWWEGFNIKALPIIKALWQESHAIPVQEEFQSK